MTINMNKTTMIARLAAVAGVMLFAFGALAGCSGGGATPPANPCTANPFGDTCTDARYNMPKQTACLADTGADSSCLGDSGMPRFIARATLLMIRPLVWMILLTPARLAACLGDTNADGTCTALINEATVNTADLPTYPTTVAGASSTTSFLTIIGTEIDTTGVTQASDPPTIRGATRAGDDMDGFRYFTGQVIATGNTETFAGILPTTNLGMPLIEAPTTIEWPGKFSGNGITGGTITFKINFADNEITGTDVRAFTTTFTLDFTPAGFVTGTMAQTITSSGNVDSSGNVIGLVGQEGLVGIFSSTNYVGGFVAKNPDFTDPTE